MNEAVAGALMPSPVKLWIRRSFAHGGVQIVAQAAGLVSGVLIVRGLDKPHYATYSLSLWLISAVTLIADAGIASVLLSMGQALREDEVGLRRLFQVSGRFRLTIGGVVTGLGLIWLGILVVHAGTDRWTSFKVLAITGVTLAPTIAAGSVQAFHRIYLNTARLRLVLWVPPTVRLGATVVLAVLGLVTLDSVLVVGLGTALLTVWLLAFRTGRIVRPGRVRAPDLSRHLRGVALRVFPTSVALVICEQALYGIIAIRGSTTTLAEFAALSRFSAAFAVLNPVVADIVAPLFARFRGNRVHLAARFGGFAAAYLLLVAVFGLVAWLAAPLLLWILGPGYDGLVGPLVIVCTAFGISYFGYALNQVTLARGWVGGSWAYLALSGLWLIWALWFADVSSIERVGWLFASLVAIWPLTQLIRAGLGLAKQRDGERPSPYQPASEALNDEERSNDE